MLPLLANQRILQLISEAEGPITLGLLPLPAVEEAECINQVVDSCRGNVNNLITLLRQTTPAAAAYAIAAGASQAVTEGKKFWLPVSEKLGIPLEDSNDRERLSQCFQTTCRTLGVVDPDVSSMSWKNIAPMMAQASILHRWVESLAHSLKATIRDRPLPDLNDLNALQRFALDLAERTPSNQPNLRSILRTEVGSVVAHRLIASCVYDQFSILPSHLIIPIQAALAGSGRQVSLKSPFASFSLVHGCFELVLPKQPASLTTSGTHWRVKGIQYSPISEQRLSEHEIGTGEFSVELKDLGKGYRPQTFDVRLGLNQPFRVFDLSNLRERPVSPGEETVLTPADYLLVMKSECTTNEPELEEVRGHYRILQQVAMRPGWNSLVIQHDGVESILSPALKAGIYQSSAEGLSTLLTDGKRLHYGNAFGFLAYIPKGQHSGTLKVEISSRDVILLEDEKSLESELEGVYDYSSALEESINTAVSSLTAGLHPIKIEIRTLATSVTRELWFWKGLDRISKYLGFLCSEAPKNIDYKRSRGLKRSDRGCMLADDYHAPRIVIAVTEGDVLEITRPGVRAVSLDPSDGWQAELSAREVLTISETDNRLITFESGGFEKWSLRCNGKEFGVLDKNRTTLHLGLRSLMAEFGQSGSIEAQNDSGESLRLFGFASDLVAKSLKHEIDHGHGLHRWGTSIPTEKLGRLGLSVRDYGESPVPLTIPTIELFRDQPEGEIWTVQVGDGLDLEMQHLPPEGNVPARLRFSMEVCPSKVSQKLLLIEWLQAASETEVWQPLYCIDGPKTSRLALIVQGDGSAGENDFTWWHHLWRVNTGRLMESDLALYANIPESEIETALDTISLLTAIKYPSSVYFESAKYLSTLAHKLSERRKGAQQRDDSAWWRIAAEEIQQHAAEKNTPVVRNFLFSCNLHTLTHRWSSGPRLGDGRAGDVVSCLHLGQVVRQAGGRVNYTKQVFHDKAHPPELFTSFENFNQVLGGQSSNFSKFNFQCFFKAILERALQHSESGIPLDSVPLLSARHLLKAITALNRRVRILAQASNEEAEHPLTKSLQALASVHNNLELMIPPLNQKIGYLPSARGANLDRPDHFESHYFPDLPALGFPQAKQLADLTWGICLLTRCTANGVVDERFFQDRLRLFVNPNVQASPINLVLSFAPELFAYYVALLDFSLFVNSTSSKS